jgi:hypothetical protein
MVRFAEGLGEGVGGGRWAPEAERARAGCTGRGEEAGLPSLGPILRLREAAAVLYGEPVGLDRSGPEGGSETPTPDDHLDDLAEEITTLAAHIHAATHRLLVLLADFDHLRGWEREGHRSCAHWLHFRTGIDLGAARERVRAARALVHLPETGAAMARGELSFSKVRALTRVATPESEAELLPLALGCTTAQLERIVRGWKRGSDADEATRERELHASRFLSVFPDDEGMYLVKGRLPAEIGALLMRAIEAASDALYRKEQRVGELGHTLAEDDDGRVRLLDPDESRAQAARRRADALGLLAERALEAGFGPGETPVSGTRAQRYQVVLHVHGEGGPGNGGAHLDDGTRVSAETSRRLACDTAVVRAVPGEWAVHGERGSPRGGGSGQGPVDPLHLGQRTRSISPALRRALHLRDRGCRFPGCGLRFTDAHHIVHWAHGGETSLANTLLLCRHHHRLVHEGGWSVERDPSGEVVFRDPRGSELRGGGVEKGPVGGVSAETPGQVHEAPSPLHALLADHHAMGIHPDPSTPSARWRRDVDVPLDVRLRASEAAG